MPHQENQSAQESVKRLHELVKGIQYCMLTTHDEKGRGLHSRPMTLQDAENAAGDFWFFVGKSSAPAREVVLDPQVNLSFAKPGSTEYVSVSGEAELVEDRAKARELWSPILKAWFPKGLEDPELALLRVRVKSADYWETPSSTATQLVGFAKAILTGKKAGTELGRREHLDASDLAG